MKKASPQVVFQTEAGAFVAHLDEGTAVCLPLDLGDGQANPNAYFAKPPERKPYVFGDFTGSLKLGGPVDYFEWRLSPHGNGTHTECLSHVADVQLSIYEAASTALSTALLVSAEPQATRQGNRQITWESIAPSLERAPFTPASLLIRTLPNSDAKKTRKYSGSNPPYLEAKIGEMLFDLGIKHIVVDLPSVDPEEDAGQLRCHKAFWGLPDKPRRDALITELAFMPNKLPDGLYALNLQVLQVKNNASPSRLLVWPLEKL